MQARIAVAVGLTFAGVLSASAQITPAEQRCQSGESRVMARYASRVVKCGIRCQRAARRGLVPFSDCYAPYGGAMLACLTDPIHGAQPTAVARFRRVCDPAVKPSNDCPECYNGGNCATMADDRVQNVQGQLDSLGPGLFCDMAPTIPEARCMDATVKTLLKFGNALHRCFDECFRRARAGAVAEDACMPFPTDPKTQFCTAKLANEAVPAIDAACAPPRGQRPTCEGNTPYPDGTTWVNLIEIGAEGNVPSKYCSSPGGAFVE